MSNVSRHLLRVGLVLSPAILTLILLPLSKDSSGLAPTAAFFTAVILGAPLIALVGIIVSAIGKNKPNAELYALWVYVGAALLTCLYLGSAYIG